MLWVRWWEDSEEEERDELHLQEEGAGLQEEDRKRRLNSGQIMEGVGFGTGSVRRTWVMKLVEERAG